MASTPTSPTGPTSPTLTTTYAEAGASEFAGSESRSFNYYTPKGRKATVYEDVTVDVQPDPDRYLLQGWVYAFANGVAGFSPTWTKVKSSDWHAFRDPNEEWERTIYIRQANTERQIQRNLEIAKVGKVFDTWDATWIKILQTHVSATMHPEHYLGMHTFIKAQRDAMTNMINNAISVNAMDKLRYAQDLALYNLELSEHVPGFDGSVHKETWLKDPIWRATRENVERLGAVDDWCEAIFATNVVYEPLVGELFRSGFVMQTGAPHNDFVTPTVVGVAEVDYEHSLRYTTELLSLLAEDPEHGDANKQVMREWLGTWVPYSVTAARQLQPLWSQAKVKVLRFEDAFDRARHRLESILSTLGLALPGEVKL